MNLRCITTSEVDRSPYQPDGIPRPAFFKGGVRQPVLTFSGGFQYDESSEVRIFGTRENSFLV